MNGLANKTPKTKVFKKNPLDLPYFKSTCVGRTHENMFDHLPKVSNPNLQNDFNSENSLCSINDQIFEDDFASKDLFFKIENKKIKSMNLINSNLRRKSISNSIKTSAQNYWIPRKYNSFINLPLYTGGSKNCETGREAVDLRKPKMEKIGVLGNCLNNYLGQSRRKVNFTRETFKQFNFLKKIKKIRKVGTATNINFPFKNEENKAKKIKKIKSNNSSMKNKIKKIILKKKGKQIFENQLQSKFCLQVSKTPSKTFPFDLTSQEILLEYRRIYKSRSFTKLEMIDDRSQSKKLNTNFSLYSAKTNIFRNICRHREFFKNLKKKSLLKTINFVPYVNLSLNRNLNNFNNSVYSKQVDPQLTNKNFLELSAINLKNAPFRQIK